MTSRAKWFVYGLPTVFLAVGLALGAWLIFRSPPKVEAASNNSSLLLTSSGASTNMSKYWSLKSYANDMDSYYNTYSSNCAANGGHNDASIPWLPAQNSATTGTSFTYDGNDMSRRGDCKARYTDGGSDTPAWLSSAWSSWTAIGSSAGYSSASVFVPQSRTASCNALYGNTGTTPMIFGDSSYDFNDQAYGAGGIFASKSPEQAPNTSSNVYLYGNGTSLIRNTFNISAADYAKIQAGAPTKFYAVADDWLALYINGSFVSSTGSTGDSIASTVVNSYLRQGQNTIAIQVVDKAYWGTVPPSYGVSSGVCYNLAVTINNSGNPASGNCPGDPTIAADTKVTTTMPYTGNSAGAHATTSTRNAGTAVPSNYNEYDPIGVKWQGAQDKDIGDSDPSSNHDGILATYVSETGILTGITNGGSGSITLDYKPYLNNYPYDSNQATVTYDSYWKHIVWRVTSSSTSSCTSGDKDNGNTCTHSTPYDPGNQGPHSGGCKSWNPVPVGHAPSCHEYNPPIPNPCPTGGCYTYNDYYKITTDTWSAGPATIEHSANTVSSHAMSACFNRQFEVSWPSTPTGGLDSDEDPTSANFTGNVSVHFHGPVDSKDLRKASTVSLGYSGDISFPYNISPYGSCSGGSFTVTSATQSPDDSYSSGFTLTCPIQAPPLNAGEMVCADFFVSPEEGEVDQNGNMSNTSGQITANPCTRPLTNLPYANFYGNDVFAGGAFDNYSDQCSSHGVNPSASGVIVASTEANIRGSGSQFAALALGAITKFNSAILRGGNSPSSPLGLTFANSPPAGNLGTGHCITNYAGGRPSDAAPWTGSFANDASQQVYYANPGVLSVPMVPDGVSAVIYVNGDVTINSDIAYQTNGWTMTSANQSNIPSLYIIASGNINIGPSVTKLSGVYVAQNGTIDTCATHDFISCQKQLVVYGSFIANKINLYRTFSSLRNSTSAEHPSSPFGPESDSSAAGGGRCSQGDNAHPNIDNANRSSVSSKAYDCAAEVFIFSPANYLSRPAVPQTGDGKAIEFDSISSLSPVL
ncbi:MAG: hypothetical protein ABI220_04990 [Candidatus Saccharimonadales bacterium]